MRNHTIDVEQERVFRTHCSARHGITIPSETNKGEGDVLLKPKEEAPLGDKIEEEEEEEEAAEAWDLVKILSAAEVSGSCPVVCQTEGCRLKAGLIYMSSSGEKWYGCLDCQVCFFLSLLINPFITRVVEHLTHYFPPGTSANKIGCRVRWLA